MDDLAVFAMAELGLERLVSRDPELHLLTMTTPQNPLLKRVSLSSRRLLRPNVRRLISPCTLCSSSRRNHRWCS